MLPSIQALMTGLIDYAGLFPPAKLPMPPAVENYARERRGLDEWMLGRFICPASRLAEFSRAAAPLLPGTHATSGYREMADTQEPWQLSVLIDGTLRDDLDLIARFNDHHAKEDHGLAMIDAVELRASDPGWIEQALELVPDELFPFFELPVAPDPRGLVASLAGAAAAAKIRTGGTSAEMFPAPGQVAAFLSACGAADVPFKATAGLHHPLRGEYPLTYEPNCPRGTMYGFLNVFVAAAALRARRAETPQLVAILEERDPKAFHFTPDGLRWRDLVLDVAQLAKVRESFALSYGSCSFDEPTVELRRLGLLD